MIGFNFLGLIVQYISFLSLTSFENAVFPACSTSFDPLPLFLASKCQEAPWACTGWSGRPQASQCNPEIDCTWTAWRAFGTVRHDWSRGIRHRCKDLATPRSKQLHNWITAILKGGVDEQLTYLFRRFWTHWWDLDFHQHSTCASFFQAWKALKAAWRCSGPTWEHNSQIPSQHIKHKEIYVHMKLWTLMVSETLLPLKKTLHLKDPRSRSRINVGKIGFWWFLPNWWTFEPILCLQVVRPLGSKGRPSLECWPSDFTTKSSIKLLRSFRILLLRVMTVGPPKQRLLGTSLRITKDVFDLIGLSTPFRAKTHLQSNDSKVVVYAP